MKRSDKSCSDELEERLLEGDVISLKIRRSVQFAMLCSHLLKRNGEATLGSAEVGTGTSRFFGDYIKILETFHIIRKTDEIKSDEKIELCKDEKGNVILGRYRDEINQTIRRHFKE